jgi:hypothetical protein
MQGVERPDRELFDAAGLVGHLVPPGSMFAFLAEHRADVFPDVDFADLFTPGRAARRSRPRCWRAPPPSRRNPGGRERAVDTAEKSALSSMLATC